MGFWITGSAIRGIIRCADRAPGSCAAGQILQSLVLEAGICIWTALESAAEGVAGDSLMLCILTKQIDRAKGDGPLGGNE